LLPGVAIIIVKIKIYVYDIAINPGGRGRSSPVLTAGYNFEERVCCRLAVGAASGNKWLNRLLQSPERTQAWPKRVPSTT
jgi:hypothetical protein